jgi:hypothetical protein
MISLLGTLLKSVLKRPSGPKRDKRIGGFIIYTHHKHNYNGQTRQGEMGKTCSTHGREKKCIRNLGRKTGSKETTRKTQTQTGR